MTHSRFIVLIAETRNTMEQFSSFFVITRLLILLNSATVIVSQDQGDFSETFRHVVENILGIKDFEVITSDTRLLRICIRQIFSKAFYSLAYFVTYLPHSCDQPFVQRTHHANTFYLFIVYETQIIYFKILKVLYFFVDFAFLTNISAVFVAYGFDHFPCIYMGDHDESCLFFKKAIFTINVFQIYDSFCLKFEYLLRIA